MTKKKKKTKANVLTYIKNLLTEKSMTGAEIRQKSINNMNFSNKQITNSLYYGSHNKTANLKYPVFEIKTIDGEIHYSLSNKFLSKISKNSKASKVSQASELPSSNNEKMKIENLLNSTEEIEPQVSFNNYIKRSPTL